MSLFYIRKLKSKPLFYHILTEIAPKSLNSLLMKISVSYQCEVLIKLQIIDVGHKPRALQDKRRLSFFTVTVITMSKFIFTVSSTLLCPTKFCVHTYPKGLLFTFHISTCCGRIMLRLRSTSVSNRDVF